MLLTEQPALGRRLLAEGVGAAGLVAAVVGSGIAAERLSPDDTGLQLLENTAATVAALIALILALGAVSGAHFNPVVTLADRLRGGIDNQTAVSYGVVQIVGGCAGAVVANLMFELPAVDVSGTHRSGAGLWLGEAVATFGLVVVVLGVARSRRGEWAAVAVGAYIGAAYWFTSSTSFANPAVTVARTLSDSFSGIHPGSVPAFVIAQLVGGALAVAFARVVFTDLGDSAVDVVVPAEPADT